MFCKCINVSISIISLIVTENTCVFSATTAESRQASGQRPGVFPQVHHSHWCPAARKVGDLLVSTVS